MTTKITKHNFNPNIWGPKAWFFLDTVILSYPDNPSKEHKEDFASFIYLISSMLPCQKCSYNYKDHLKLNPLTDNVLDNRENLLEWWLKMHNLVRMEQNKEMFTKTTFINYYNKMYSSDGNCNRNTVRNIIYVCVFILLIMWFKDLIFKRRLNN